MTEQPPKVVARTVSAVAGILVALILVELSARAYYMLATLPPEKAVFYRSQPASYRDAPYFSEEFVSEAENFPAGITTPEGTSLLVMDDLQRTHFTIENGQRRTIGQPAVFKRRLALYGSSVVLGTTVPDAHTITSYLQGMINADGHSVRVENLGVISARAFQQLELLRMEGVNSGDLVIFFDGGADILNGVYYNVRGELLSGRDNAKINPLKRFLLDNVSRIRKWWATLRFLNDLFLSKFPAHLGREEDVRRLVAKTAESYLKTVHKAHEEVAAAGAQFLHIFQPNIYTRDKPSRYEKEVMTNFFLSPRGMEVAFAEGNRVFRKGLDRLAAKGVRTFDFSTALNPKPEGVEYYLDFVHVNHTANRILARRIYDIIQNDLLR